MIATTTPTPPPPAQPLLTIEEFAERYANHRVELVKGHVVELPMPDFNHGKVCNWVGYYLTQHVAGKNLGHVMSCASFIRIGTNPPTVRGADVCFISYELLPKGEIPRGVLPQVPELVFEVRSPSDGWNDVFTKVGEYLTAGVRVVVVIDSDSATASVYRKDEFSTDLRQWG